MDRKPCEHIMDSGRNCASPRMNRHRFCYWHNRLHTAHYLPGNPKYEPPVLDSANAVALALNHVYRGQSRGLIDGRTARPLQQSLHLALQAFRMLDHPQPAEMVTDDIPVSSEEDRDGRRSPSTGSAPDRSAGGSPAVARTSSSDHQLTRSSDRPLTRYPDTQLSSSSDLSNDSFTTLADSSAGLRLTPEKERTIAGVLRRSAG